MALVTVNGKAGGADLSVDSRFKQWGKLVRSAGDVDLAKSNGYALSGPFAKWGSAVALEPGQFLVLSSETGSRARHDYDYALIGVNPAGEAESVARTAIDAAVATQSDAIRAKAANSRLYAMAVYCTVATSAPAVEDRAALVEAARSALAALTSAERAALAAEFA